LTKARHVENVKKWLLFLREELIIVAADVDEGFAPLRASAFHCNRRWRIWREGEIVQNSHCPRPRYARRCSAFALAISLTLAGFASAADVTQTGANGVDGINAPNPHADGGDGGNGSPASASSSSSDASNSTTAIGGNGGKGGDGGLGDPPGAAGNPGRAGETAH